MAPPDFIEIMHKQRLFMFSLLLSKIVRLLFAIFENYIFFSEVASVDV